MVAEPADSSDLAVAGHYPKPYEYNASRYVGRSQLWILRASVLVYSGGALAVLFVRLCYVRETHLLLSAALDASDVWIILLVASFCRPEVQY